MNSRRLKKAIQRITRLPGGRYLFLYAANKIRHFYLKIVRSTRVAHPSTIMLELTNHCNLACTTCPREYAYGKTMDKGNMAVAEAYKIIDETWPYLDSIGLTGMGEPFLYPEIEKIVDYIRKKNKGIIISLSTNAQLPAFIERIRPIIHKIDTVQVSIDGLGDVYESIRKNAHFDRLDNNLRQLALLCKGTRTDLMLNMVVTRENYTQMSDMVAYAAETGIRYVDFTLFNLAAVTDIDISYYELYRTPEFLQAVKNLEMTAGMHKNVLITNKNFTTENSFRKCPFPWNHFYICWNGFVVPCCAKPFPKEMNFGNAFHQGLMPVLNSNGFRKFRELWFANKTPVFCQKCHFIDIEPIR